MTTHHHRGLYRNTNQSIIGGVSAGIADNLNTDPTLIRVIFLALAFLGGGGVLIYCILWIALPAKNAPMMNIPYTEEDHLNKEEPKVEYDQSINNDLHSEIKKLDSTRGSLIAGIILITIGILFLLSRIIPRIDFINFWPVLLLIVGIVMIFLGLKEQKNNKE